MHPVRKQRLIVVSLVVVVLSSAAVGLVAFALRDNINLFYPPADVVAGKAPVDQGVSGWAVWWLREVSSAVTPSWIPFSGSQITRRQCRCASAASFPTCLLKEGVVAEGVLDDNGMLIATQVLAKHDENYMPPEVAAALEGKTAPGGATALP